MAEKNFDGYNAKFKDYEELISDVLSMEEESDWVHGVPTKDIELEAVYPVEACDAACRYNLNQELTMETASPSSTQLIAKTGAGTFLVRDTAIGTLQESAKLSGSALGRMNPEAYSRVLNEGLRIAKGSTLLLERCGKLSAFHSSANGGYEIMPISGLLEETKRTAEDKFGYIEFKEGYNSHSVSEAMWLLPDAEKRLNNAYQDALASSKTLSNYNISFMPALKFSSSDTAQNSATVAPVFMFPGQTDRYIQFVEGIKVRHSKRSLPLGVSGSELFAQKISDIYARVNSFTDEVKRLAGILIQNPENCIVSLCNKYGISKRYGDAAREEILRYSAGRASNAHEVVLALTASSAQARSLEASRFVINEIDEQISKIAMLSDFSEHDVGGVVAW